MGIFITGGTSGLGLALALAYTARGEKVAVCGRHPNRLPQNDKTAQIALYQADVRDKQQLTEAITDFSRTHGLHLLIVCAGNYSRDENFRAAFDMISTNISGALNALEIGAEIMSQHGGGRLAVVSSVAGLLHYRQASVYAKCRRTLIQICDTYRRAFQNNGIHVTTIIPGYIDTERLRELNNGKIEHKHFCVTTDYAVRKIIEALEKQADTVIFPPRMKRLMAILKLLPKPLLALIMNENKKYDARKRG